jgi:hypothetical protein
MARASKSGSETGKPASPPKPRVTRNPSAGGSPKRASSQRVPRSEPALEDRERMIQEGAYYKAEQRGFEGGSPEQDWLEAEREVDALLMHKPGR